MTKLLNYYICERGHEWQNLWDCAVDDDCPHCDINHSPYHSIDPIDLLEFVKEAVQHFEWEHEQDSKNGFPDEHHLLTWGKSLTP